MSDGVRKYRGIISHRLGLTGDELNSKTLAQLKELLTRDPVEFPKQCRACELTKPNTSFVTRLTYYKLSNGTNYPKYDNICKDCEAESKRSTDRSIASRSTRPLSPVDSEAVGEQSFVKEGKSFSELLIPKTEEFFRQFGDRFESQSAGLNSFVQFIAESFKAQVKVSGYKTHPSELMFQVPEPENMTLRFDCSDIIDSFLSSAVPEFSDREYVKQSLLVQAVETSACFGNECEIPEEIRTEWDSGIAIVRLLRTDGSEILFDKEAQDRARKMFAQQEKILWSKLERKVHGPGPQELQRRKDQEIAAQKRAQKAREDELFRRVTDFVKEIIHEPISRDEEIDRQFVENMIVDWAFENLPADPDLEKKICERAISSMEWNIEHMQFLRRAELNKNRPRKPRDELRDLIDVAPPISLDYPGVHKSSETLEAEEEEFYREQIYGPEDLGDDPI